MLKFNLLYRELKLWNICNIRRMCGHSKAIVRSTDDDFLDISFSYGNDALKERRFCFHRPKEEILQSCFARMNKSIASAIEKKNKRKKLDLAEEHSDAALYIKVKHNNEVLSESTRNVSAFIEGAIMCIGETAYDVVVNIPTVRSITLPSVIMVGFPVYPHVQLEFAFKADCQFVWYRLLTKYEKRQYKKEKPLTNLITSLVGTWAEVGRGFLYVPDADDKDRKLKVVCLPKSGSREGLEESAESKCMVGEGPDQYPFEDRHLQTKTRAATGRFRCVSYNVLAQVYGDTDVSKTVLYPYCPPHALSMDYRKQLLLKEITGYNADLICLQEVDNKIFENDFVPVFRELNYDGIITLKGTNVSEGPAIFYHLPKFRFLREETIVLTEVVQNDNFSDIYEKILENEKLKERMLARNNVLQVVLLESVDTPGKRLIVGNTHFYFYPDADHVRLLQAAISLRYLELKLKQHTKENPNVTTTLVLCGDFNSCPEFAVYQLATTGQVSEECPDWRSNEEEAVNGLAVSTGLNLKSACGCSSYTNYTEGFKGCLDYIFYDTNQLEVEGYVPFPTEEQLKQHTALPSIVFPSDHVALIATLQWR